MVLGDRQVREVVVLDKLTYAGNLENLAPVANDPRYRFVRGDICDAAAESHAATARCPASRSFAASCAFDGGLRRTVGGTSITETWVKRVRSGEYQRYYEKNCLNREAGRRLPRC